MKKAKAKPVAKAKTKTKAQPKRDRTQSNAERAFRAVRESLTQVGWEPEETDVEGMLRVDFRDDDIPVADALAIVRFDTERFLWYLNFRSEVPSKLRGEMSEFLTRANSGLVVGNFEMDWTDGAVRFKSSVDFTEEELSATLIRNAIVSAMDVVEHYGELLEQVARGKLSALKAAAKADATL